MLTREAVLSVLQRKGPCLPVHIKQALGEGDTFTIGALLTELREAGKLKISNTKRGGSPFYYVPEHAYRMAEHLDDLGEKERRAAQLLKERKVLRDKEQEPLTRVCLRQIKDFAIPVEAKTKDGAELFWKWYLLPNDEAENQVKQALGITPEQAKEQPRNPPAQAATPATTPQHTPTERPAEPRPTPTTKALKEQDDTGDPFLRRVLAYFTEKRIHVTKKDVKRKDSDIEFEITLPTAVGRVDYFCKAKNKKKCNDGDLSSAYLQGQGKKLPVLFITTGDVAKKAKDKLKHEYKGLLLVQI
ncbi:hypothetical protein JXA12_02300 [Candidatus Woesearchaeota archaeon]|nr:hypothetical protein [Candidatus Woesearchaeota archaeon]